MFSHKIKGFTLIELLIVIVIIGILAVSLIPRIQGMQNKARYVRVQKYFEHFNIAILLAQNNTNKSLKDITNSTFTVGVCRNTALSGMNRTNVHLPSIASNHACRLAWVSSLRKIELAAGMSENSLSNLEKDPWGSPYLLEENEGEFNATDCRSDMLWSAGPDGYFDRRNGDGYNDWVPMPGIPEDSVVLKIRPQSCPGGY